MPEIPIRVVSFLATEGTLMSIDVSPDGKTLIFDLLGDIYSLPVNGGQAAALTSGRAWDQAPRFSPDGKSIYFVSDRRGYKNIWRLMLLDRSLRQVTRSKSDIVGTPNWSQDGSHLIAGRGDPLTHNTEYILYRIDPITGKMTPIDAPSGPWLEWDTFKMLRPRLSIYSGVESVGSDVFFSQAERDKETRRSTVRLYKFDLDAQLRTMLTPKGASYSEYNPQLSHDGKLLAYFRQYDDRRTELRILDRTTGQDKSLIELTDADDACYFAMEDTTPDYAFTPDNRSLIFWNGGKIHRVSLADRSSEVIPFRVNVTREVVARVLPTIKHLRDRGEAKIIRWPSMSRDGKVMAFAAIGYVWVMDVTTGEFRRLTDSTDFEYMPAISPDGHSVAYVSFAHSGNNNNFGSGRLVIVKVDGGTPRVVLGGPKETFLLPKWSQNGQKVALIRELKKDSGVEAAFGWTPSTSARFHEVASAPPSSARLTYYIYARYVGFDGSDRRLLFSFPRSGEETVLAEAELDGSDNTILAIGTPEVGGITPAPNLRNLVLTRRDGTVWVVPFDSGAEPAHVSTTSPDARRISDSGGYYVDWNRPDQFTFGSAQDVYRYRLNDGALEMRRVKVTFVKPQASKPIAFKNARILTMSDNSGVGRILEPGTIVVEGQRISAIGPATNVVIPPDAQVIDLTGETIIPGLLDVHYHRIGGFNLSAFELPNSDFSDYSAVAYGATTAWEPGASPNDGVPATVDLQRAGRITGPRWSHSAMGAVGHPWELLTSYTAALEAVQQHKELGVDVLKEYTTPTRKQRQWLSAAAYQTGMGIVSHLQSFDGMMTRIVDGYTGGDHPYIPMPFYKDVREMLRQTGYIWTPNVVITAGTVGARQREKDYYCHALFDWWTQTGQKPRKTNPVCRFEQRKSLTVPYDVRRVSRVARRAASAANNGISIGVSAHGIPASSLHREMWYLWKGGMSIEDVLRATTIGNAKKLGLQQEVGSLEKGKLADFVILDENPLENILNTLSLSYTVQGGVVYDSSTALPVEISNIQTAGAITP